MAQAAVLMIEDEGMLAKNVQRYLAREGFEVRTAGTGAEGLRLFEEYGPDVVLLDLGLPDLPGQEVLGRIRHRDAFAKVIILTAQGSTQAAVEAMKAGAFDFLTKPMALGELKLALDKAMGQGRMEGTLSYYTGRDARGLQQMLGNSPPMQDLKRNIARLLEAERSLPEGQPGPAVLVRGETGSGKELVARALHFDGHRRGGPFVEVNCAALPSHLLEAELFGHERGAFTDARERRIGLVEAAHGGTLFLDEIGDLDAAVQVKLLRLLEDRTVRRLGSVRDRRIDVRFVTATHRPLEEMVQQGRFRADLYYRLRVVTLQVPPLRDRGGDALVLAGHFLALHGRRYGKPRLHLSTEARAMLARHPWPGNVRELTNAMEQAALSADGERVEAANLALVAPAAPRPVAPEPEGAEAGGGSALTLAEVENMLIARAMAVNAGNVSRAARDLGITRDTLRYRLGKQGT